MHTSPHTPDFYTHLPAHPRQEINSKNTTWHAAVSDKFRNTPLGSHNNLVSPLQR